MVIGFMGVSEIKATTDTPAARVTLSYMRRGETHQTEFSLQELLDGITQDTAESETPAPDGLTDIADIP